MTAARTLMARPNALPHDAGGGEIHDLRFRALIPETDWQTLSPAIRRRFSKRLAGGASAVYAGVVTACRMSRAGWCLAQVARLVGGPLPTSRAAGLASVVTVTEDGRGGQTSTRLYVRPNGFPQVIHSAKRFAGPTGLEEHVGAGLGMSLLVAVEEGMLVFRSRGFFLEAFGKRLTLPAWLSPGALTVTHAETGLRAFRFTLDIRHPLPGLMLRQEAEFSDTAPTEIAP